MKLIDNNPVQRAVAAVTDSLPGGGKLGLPGGRSHRKLKASLPNGKAVEVSLPQGKELKSLLSDGTATKAGLVAGGLAGITAVSAGISSLRRQTEGKKDAS